MLIVVIMSSPRALELSYGPASKINNFIGRIFANTPGGDVAGPLMLWLMFTPWLALFAIIGVHELGHVMAGKGTGVCVIGMELGPLAMVPLFLLQLCRQNPRPGAARCVLFVPWRHP